MPGKLIPGEEKTPVYKKSGPFTLRSGNKSPLAYKLMGSSPAKHIVPYVVGEDYQDAEDHNTKHANEKKV